MSQIAALVFVVLAFIFPLSPGQAAATEEVPYEVWVVDQSDTTADGGGTLYVYRGDSLAGKDAAVAVPEVIDLGAEARSLCLAQSGTAPKRPHMLFFNADQSHALLSFVATGHVLFLDAPTRKPVACIDVGDRAHAAVPSPDQSYVLVVNEKLLQRIITEYGAGTFQLDNGATLDMATCTTPNGVLCESPEVRPDNAAICPVIDSSSRFAFVTLRGGGLFVVNARATPMAIVAEYDKATVHPNGCGGAEVAGKMYINSGGGTAANPLESDLYAFPLGAFTTDPNPPNTPAPKVVFSHDAEGFVDSHGVILTKHGRFLWAGDRAANRIIVVDTTTDKVVAQIPLAGPLSDDPAPDLMAIAPSGNRVFMTLRGPSPLTGNAAAVNNAVGSTPGLGVVRVEASGSRGVFQAVAPISHVVGNVEKADPHGIAVRRL